MALSLSNLSQFDRGRLATVQSILPLADAGSRMGSDPALRSYEQVAVSATGELVLVEVTRSRRRIKRRATLVDCQAAGLSVQ